MRWSQRSTAKAVAGVSSPGLFVRDRSAEPVSQPVDELTAELTRLRATDRPTPGWFRAIEQCRESALQLKHELDRSLAGLALPLDPDSHALSRQCANIHWLLGQCYIKAARFYADTGDRRTANANCLLKACYWGIASLAEYLLIIYERYSRIEPGTWHEIHELYNSARSEGIQSTRLDKRSDSPRTVEHIYKRLLLLGLSDPLHHPFRALAKIYERLDRWAVLASLTTEATRAERCLFIVDPSLDRPAVPALARSNIRPECNERWLDTRRLVDGLKREHGKAVNAAVNHVNQPGGIADNLDDADLLRRLVINWGIHRIRRTTRKRTYRTCEAVVGLNGVCLALNDFRPLPEKTGNGPTAGMLSMLKGNFGQQMQVTETESIVNQWEIVDESERGFRLITGSSEILGRVAIGQVVAVRTGRDWDVGTIHWAQADDQANDPDGLAIGVKKLMLPAEAAAVIRMGTEGARSQPEPALLLLDETRDKPVVSLLCSRGSYSPAGMYLVRRIRDGREFIVEATNIRLATRAFNWFEIIKPRAGSTQRTLDLIFPY